MIKMRVINVVGKIIQAVSVVVFIFGIGTEITSFGNYSQDSSGLEMCVFGFAAWIIGTMMTHIRKHSKK